MTTLAVINHIKENDYNYNLYVVNDDECSCLDAIEMLCIDWDCTWRINTSLEKGVLIINKE